MFVEKKTLEIFPLATVVLDDDSKILSCNTLFENATHNFFELGDIFENAFVNQIGYIYVDPVFDWKHDVMEFYETNKILLQLGKIQKEFYIHTSMVQEDACYIVCLCELIHYK